MWVVEFVNENALKEFEIKAKVLILVTAIKKQNKLTQSYYANCKNRLKKFENGNNWFYNIVFDKMTKTLNFKKEYEALAPEFELKRQLKNSSEFYLNCSSLSFLVPISVICTPKFPSTITTSP